MITTICPDSSWRRVGPTELAREIRQVPRCEETAATGVLGRADMEPERLLKTRFETGRKVATNRASMQSDPPKDYKLLIIVLLGEDRVG